MNFRRMVIWLGCFVFLLLLALSILFFTLKGKPLSVMDSHFSVPNSPWEIASQKDQVGAALFAPCASCHMADGQGRKDGSIPALAGRSETALRTALQAIKQGERYSPAMMPFARALSDQEIDQVAHYLSQLKSAQRDE